MPQVSTCLRVGKWVLLPLSIIFVFLSWLAAGILTALGLILADLCVSPTQVRAPALLQPRDQCTSLFLQTHPA